MREHRVEIKDAKGQTMRVVIRQTIDGKSTWRALDYGFLRYHDGAADLGRYDGTQRGWVALYGGPEVDDSKLVLHLDDFSGFTTLGTGGTGKVYKQDYILMQPGAVTWHPAS